MSSRRLRVVSLVTGLQTGMFFPLHGHGAVLFQEPFEDTNYSSRGWYDTTGGALSSTEHIPGSTKSFECRFLAGAQKCSGGTPHRVLFQETDSVYVSFWIKHSTNWTASNKPYHPHMFLFLTNQNDQWVGPAFTRLTAYIEENEGVPLLGIQDGQNVDQTKINQNLINITENRAVAGCNGNHPDGYTSVSCYDAGGAYRNFKQWNAGQVYFQDTAGPYYKNDWHHIEAYFKLNTIQNSKGVGDGMLKYWYDGQLIIDRSNVMFRTNQHAFMKFKQFMIVPYIGDGSPVDQTFWIDNLVIETERPGAVLSPPRNLRIQ